MLQLLVLLTLRIVKSEGERGQYTFLPSFADILYRTSHVFDGQTLTKETAAFQLCDITDPMLKEMIESVDDLRDTCDVSFRGFTLQALSLTFSYRKEMAGTRLLLLNESNLC